MKQSWMKLPPSRSQHHCESMSRQDRDSAHSFTCTSYYSVYTSLTRQVWPITKMHFVIKYISLLCILMSTCIKNILCLTYCGWSPSEAPDNTNIQLKWDYLYTCHWHSLSFSYFTHIICLQKAWETNLTVCFLTQVFSFKINCKVKKTSILGFIFDFHVRLVFIHGLWWTLLATSIITHNS